MANAITLEQIEILMFLEEGVDGEAYDLIIRSISIQDIHDAFQADDNLPKYSEAVIRRHIDGLVNMGYVGLGVKVGNTFTHYITPAGKQFLAVATGRTGSKKNKR